MNSTVESRSPRPRSATRIARVLAGAICVAVLTATVSMASAGAATGPTATPPLHAMGALSPTRRVAVNLGQFGMTAQTALPASVDLRAYAVPVGNQGNVGSCVTWAIDYGMLGWYSRKTGRVGQPFAPMYTYAQINGGGDNGSAPTAALAVAQSQGSDTRAHYSHDDFDWSDQPNASERANAADYKISGWHTLFSGSGQASAITALKTALSTNHPVAITIPVRHGFDFMGSAASSVDSDYTSAVRGYHEVLAVGYDAAGLIIQNSWGTYWGAAGFGRLSWAVVTHDVLEAEDIDGFAVDTATPVVTAVNVAPATTGSISTTIPYVVTWTALGTVASYHVSYSVNGGAPVAVTLSDVKATSFTFPATPGNTYAFTVTATNAGAQTSPALTSASFTPTLVQETDGSIAYSGVWTHPAASTASGGATQTTIKADASAGITTTGRRIAWIATRGTNRGSAKVYADGVLKTTVNLNGATATKIIAYTFDFGSVGTHTLQVVAAGTVGHPMIDIDAFVVTS